MSTPPKVLDLVEIFDRNADDYRSAGFNEAMLRQQFVNPLFKCLGWDMDNEQGYAEAYKDVIHEAAIKIGGATKAPDYSFRIGGTPKFYLEAKKPSVNVKDDPAPAFQLRRYAWSARMPLSIHTNFAEFAVYDCRVKPAQTDKASTARILYLRCAEFADAWDDKVAGVFAREAVLKGSFDKFADSKKGKRGTAAVDAAFLDEIESWRDELAKNLALRNPELTSRELNFAVQITIDRIIFLRMCEDRGIEPYGQLQKLQGQADVYEGLRALYQKADERYNSGLFHFHKEKERAESPDELTPRLVIDDKVLKSIFRGLYYPDSPYEFSVLPVEILGQVYEQFLGKVIRLTAAHQAKVEEKPEVKKAGGVYYTPSYIVDYIVEQTVGRLLEGKTPKEAAGLTVLDPACGSGSFLLGAYRRLLEWHLKQYEDDGPQKHKKQVFQGAGGAWRLTTAEKKRILLNNVYGVDIDPQAVEVTKLSLLLKVLEGESQETIETQLKLFHERALPDLSGNIKCGNSLIGPDFYEGRQAALFDEEERYRINVFDWQAAFPKVMKAGGFDAVIGNPPYGADYDQTQKAYFQSHFIYKEGKPETYIYFLDRSVSLLRENGKLGYITPNAWLTNHYGVQLRLFILKGTTLDILADLEPTKVFEKAVVDTAVTILSKRLPVGSDCQTAIWRGTRERTIVPCFHISQFTWVKDDQAVINTQAAPNEAALLSRLERAGTQLGSVVEFSQGAIPYESKAEGERNRYISNDQKAEDWLPLFESAAQVRRYELDKPEAFIHYGSWLCRPREPRFFSQPKILFHRLRKKLSRQLVGALEESGAVNRHALSNLILQEGFSRNMLLAVLGLFNGTLANWWFVKRYGLLMEVGGFKINKLPLPDLWHERYDSLVLPVEWMMELHKQLAVAKAPHDKTVLQGQIDATDRQIDRLVYDLYGLTDEEIRIVEGGTAT